MSQTPTLDLLPPSTRGPEQRHWCHLLALPYPSLHQHSSSGLRHEPSLFGAFRAPSTLLAAWSLLSLQHTGNTRMTLQQKSIDSVVFALKAVQFILALTQLHCTSEKLRASFRKFYAAVNSERFLSQWFPSVWFCCVFMSGSKSLLLPSSRANA